MVCVCFVLYSLSLCLSCIVLCHTDANYGYSSSNYSYDNGNCDSKYDNDNIEDSYDNIIDNCSVINCIDTQVLFIPKI